MAETLDISTLGTPDSCVADFCLIPVRSLSAFLLDYATNFTSPV